MNESLAHHTTQTQVKRGCTQSVRLPRDYFERGEPREGEVHESALRNPLQRSALGGAQ